MDARSIADRSANSQETLQIATNPLAKLAILRRRTNTAGQAEIAVGVVVGEPLVSKAHQREQRGVEVHRVHPALDGVTGELISGAVGVACFYQAAGEPHRVAVDVVIAAVAGMADLHKADARCAQSLRHEAWPREAAGGGPPTSPRRRVASRFVAMRF